MTSAMTNWQSEFGLDPDVDPDFIMDPAEISDEIPQAYTLRQAFDDLELNGILCTDNTPLIYFRCVDAIEPELVTRLHRQFWNHGRAPILVLISKNEIHVYSGMSRPKEHENSDEKPGSLITQLERVGPKLQAFILSVRSGSFFKEHAKSFGPYNRVDQDLLRNLGNTRDCLREQVSDTKMFELLDALLCRLVFTCYLFDRHVIDKQYLKEIGLKGDHLRDLLKVRPQSKAKRQLYKLFTKLGADFNGDLFAEDLSSESSSITDGHIDILYEFFHATDVSTGQKAFWPYDFKFIPIETISAIYEHFLKKENKKDGAFYTPRFLAEITLDTALEGFESLLDRTYLDPACGSGIFLVGLFNRMADEWSRKYPRARNDKRADELRELMCSSLRGVDKDLTACRITAFSLYLAYLDKLDSVGIQELQKKGRALPNLVVNPTREKPCGHVATQAIIKCTDFFLENVSSLPKVDLVIGNPPWGSIAASNTPAGRWCENQNKEIPDKQIASAFIWKSADHTLPKGKVCLVLPSGVLFNQGPKAVTFQNDWVRSYTIDRILNLADLRLVLFHKALHPALVVRYSQNAPDESNHKIEYWAPKVSWSLTQAEIVTIFPEDRSQLSLSDLLVNLAGPDAPQIWKHSFWGTPRDQKFLDRLLDYPRLNALIQRPGDKLEDKPWILSEGFQPVGKNDKAKALKLPSRKFIGARSTALNLFLHKTDCVDISSTMNVRERSNSNTKIYKAPHVLITKGFNRIAFADFSVSFQHAVRGINGPKKDRNLLIFLTAFLKSRLAKYVGFHTASSWAIYRPMLHVNEILRLPFPLPHNLEDEDRAQCIVDEVAGLVDGASHEVKHSTLRRDQIIERTTSEIEPLVEEYFGVHPLEKILIEDTLNVIIPSIQVKSPKKPVPTMSYATQNNQTIYVKRLCSTLNLWSTRTGRIVKGEVGQSSDLGIGLAKITITAADSRCDSVGELQQDLLPLLHKLLNSIPREQQSIDPVRGLMVFDKNLLYLVKPIWQRHWTQSAALNDADMIAGTILMKTMEPA